MLKNYLAIASRNLLKTKLYTTINVVGLSLGIACWLVLSLLVLDQFAFDRDNENADDIYRVVHAQFSNNEETRIALTPGVMGPELLQNFPEIKAATRAAITSETILVEGNDPKEKRVLAVDTSYFSIFTVEMVKLAGDELLPIGGILLSETEALATFGKESPIGRIIKLKDIGEFKVHGVFKDLLRSHLRTGYVIRFEWIEKTRPFAKSWNFNSFYNYVLIDPEADIEPLNAKIDAFADQHTPQSWKSFKYFLQPLLEIYTDTSFINNPSPTIGKVFAFSFAAIGAIILLLACFNYMNMATARSAGRALEVGVRKVMGAYRRQLICQFLVESFILVTISFLLAILWADLMIPMFQQFTGASVMEMMRFDLSNFFDDYRLVIALVFCNFLLALLAGSYPAFYLSRFVPAKVLKGRQGTDTTRRIRRIIVSIQFSLTAILLICVLVIFRQVDYLKNKDLGFKKDGLLLFAAALDSAMSTESFKTKIETVPGVERIAVASSLPGRAINTTQMRKLTDSPDMGVEIGWVSIDHDFIPTLELTLLAGRNFYENGSDENSGIIINEKACEAYGWTPQEALGQKVSGFIFTDSLPGEVIGVIKDFNVSSLRRPILPLVLNYQSNNNRYLVRITGDKLRVRSEVDQLIRSVLPSTPFESRLMEDYLDNVYQVEEKLGQVLTFFCVLAVVIGCLGLYALASYEAEQRLKELGIRKIMGATSLELLFLLSRNFLKPVFISMAFAIPLAYFLGNLWLETFPYHFQWSIGVFVEAAAWLTALGWLTVVGQGIRASILNPADVLRHE